jgi:hypothetical protein
LTWPKYWPFPISVAITGLAKVRTIAGARQGDSADDTDRHYRELEFEVDRLKELVAEPLLDKQML